MAIPFESRFSEPLDFSILEGEILQDIVLIGKQYEKNAYDALFRTIRGKTYIATLYDGDSGGKISNSRDVELKYLVGNPITRAEKTSRNWQLSEGQLISEAFDPGTEFVWTYLVFKVSFYVIPLTWECSGRADLNKEITFHEILSPSFGDYIYDRFSDGDWITIHNKAGFKRISNQ